MTMPPLPDVFTAAIGATRIGASSMGGSPVSRTAVRQELARLLRSTGGRPGLEGSLRRQKIPLSGDEWVQLEYLSEVLEDSGITASAGQVARVLWRSSAPPATTMRPPRAERRRTTRAA